jgi:hypothetical protein
MGESVAACRDMSTVGEALDSPYRSLRVWAVLSFERRIYGDVEVTGSKTRGETLSQNWQLHHFGAFMKVLLHFVTLGNSE